MSLDGLVKNIKETDFKILKKQFPDKWQYLKKNKFIHMNALKVLMIIKNLMKV